MANMDAFSARTHWALAVVVLVIDICLVSATVYMDKMHYLEPPSGGQTEMTAAIGWLGVCGAVFIFGSYGILIKTPSVQEANCDCMVFQCYYSFAVAAISMLIWSVAGSSGGLIFNASSFSMGVFFATLWIASQVSGFNAINAIGYAVAPAIWVGVTICVSFVWGVTVFNNPVHSWPGAVGALVLMVVGVCLAAASSSISDRQARRSARELTPGMSETMLVDVSGSSISAQRSAPELGPGAQLAADRKSPAAGAAIFAILSACFTGLCNGSLMASMSCFENGCAAIGVKAYEGSELAPLAFLPSLAAGLVVMQPVLFSLYWGRSILAGRMPQFHFSKVAVSGLLTGAFWGMANFNAMFATVYLGQTVGFPLTQCCLIPGGFWGILYYREIKGATAIGTFVLASVVILSGATLNGMSC